MAREPTLRSSAPLVSLVVPAYNEARLLPCLLDTVDEARLQFRQGTDAVEVIVADNDSTDATAAIARARGCAVVHVPTRTIAATRNGGARVASGAVIAFVDADSRIHPQTFNAIERALENPRTVGGATGVRLDRMSLGIAITYALMLPMVWVTGMDTGVVFCRRADFQAIGGYDERLLFAEDVRLLLGLSRLGRRRGQRLIRLRPVKAIASTRKFDEHGDWHYFGLMARGVRWLLFGTRHDAFAKGYWYDVRRTS